MYVLYVRIVNSTLGLGKPTYLQIRDLRACASRLDKNNNNKVNETEEGAGVHCWCCWSWEGRHQLRRLEMNLGFSTLTQMLYILCFVWPCYTQILTFSTDVVKLLQDVVIVFCPRGRVSLAKKIAAEITSSILSRALSRASSISSRACGRLLVELCTHFTFSVFLNPISEVLHLSSRVKPHNNSYIKDIRKPGHIAKSTIL